MLNKVGDRVIFDDDNHLRLNIRYLKRVFGVTMLFEQENKQPQGMSFEMHMLIKRDINRQQSLVKIDRKDLQINDQIPNKVVDELAYHCGQTVYPLVLRVGDDWEYSEVKNHKEIIERWEQVRDRIREDYSDELVDWYLRVTDRNMKHPQSLMRAIDQNIFFAFFFSPLYRRYLPFVNVAKVKISVPILPHARPVEYSIEQEVLENYTTFNTISVIQRGNISDKRSAYDLATKKDVPVSVDGFEKATGNVSVRYELDKDTRAIDSIIADCDIALPYGQSRSVHLEAYHLNERDEQKEGSDMKNPGDYE